MMEEHDTVLVGDHYETPAFVAHSKGVTYAFMAACNPGAVWGHIVQFNGNRFSEDALFTKGWRVVPCKIHVGVNEDGQTLSPENLRSLRDDRRRERGSENNQWPIPGLDFLLGGP